MELAMLARVEITCPMNFNWFPFDTQLCHFVIHSTEFYDVTLVNVLGEEQMKQLEQQNIILNYHVKLGKLPQDRLIYETPEVRIQNISVKLGYLRYLGMLDPLKLTFWTSWGPTNRD